MAVAALVGGPELASRVYDAIDGALPGQTQTAPTQTTGGVLRGPVTRVADGDTFTIGSQRVRICGINSPERGERGYAEAGANIERMTAGQTVECRQVGNGTPCDGRSSPASYDRIVAQCFVGGRDIAAEQVRAGHAVDWTRYSGGHYERP